MRRFFILAAFVAAMVLATTASGGDESDHVHRSDW